MRIALRQTVDNAIRSNNLEHMEKVITDAVNQLKDKIFLHATASKTNQVQASMSQEYDQALMALKRCMEQVRQKLQIVGVCLF